MVSITSGYFVPPADTGYKFLVECDDYCDLYLSQTNMDPSAAARLVQTDSWSTKGQWWNRDDLTHDDYIDLEAGLFYYIELRHSNPGGNGYAKVALEIEESPVTDHDHHQAKREV